MGDVMIEPTWREKTIAEIISGYAEDFPDPDKQKIRLMLHVALHEGYKNGSTTTHKIWTDYAKKVELGKHG